MRKTLVLLVFLLCIASACSSEKKATSSGSDDASTTEPEDGTSTEDYPVVSPSDGEKSQSPDGSPSSGDPATPTNAPSDSQPNNKKTPSTQPYQIGAGSGQTMAVIAVDYNDTLNFRSDPDTSASIVVSVPPLATSPVIISQGEGVLTDTSAWWKVEINGTQAWANATFLATLGSSLSITSEVTPKLSSQQVDTVELLVKAVADTRTGDAVKTTIVQEPEAGDAIGGEVIFDATGYLDDAVQGERITMQYKFVWDDPASTSRKVVAYEFVAASSQALCSRGTSNGVCN